MSEPREQSAADSTQAIMDEFSSRAAKLQVSLGMSEAIRDTIAHGRTCSEVFLQQASKSLDWSAVSVALEKIATRAKNKAFLMTDFEPVQQFKEYIDLSRSMWETVCDLVSQADARVVKDIDGPLRERIVEGDAIDMRSNTVLGAWKSRQQLLARADMYWVSVQQALEVAVDHYLLMLQHSFRDKSTNSYFLHCIELEEVFAGAVEAWYHLQMSLADPEHNAPCPTVAALAPVEVPPFPTTMEDAETCSSPSAAGATEAPETEAPTTDAVRGQIVVPSVELHPATAMTAARGTWRYADSIALPTSSGLTAAVAEVELILEAAKERVEEAETMEALAAIATFMESNLCCVAEANERTRVALTQFISTLEPQGNDGTPDDFGKIGAVTASQFQFLAKKVMLPPAKVLRGAFDQTLIKSYVPNLRILQRFFRLLSRCALLAEHPREHFVSFQTQEASVDVIRKLIRSDAPLDVNADAIFQKELLEIITYFRMTPLSTPVRVATLGTVRKPTKNEDLPIRPIIKHVLKLFTHAPLNTISEYLRNSSAIWRSLQAPLVCTTTAWHTMYSSVIKPGAQPTTSIMKNLQQHMQTTVATFSILREYYSSAPSVYRLLNTLCHYPNDAPVGYEDSSLSPTAFPGVDAMRSAMLAAGEAVVMMAHCCDGPASFRSEREYALAMASARLAQLTESVEEADTLRKLQDAGLVELQKLLGGGEKEANEEEDATPAQPTLQTFMECYKGMTEADLLWGRLKGVAGKAAQLWFLTERYLGAAHHPTNTAPVSRIGPSTPMSNYEMHMKAQLRTLNFSRDEALFTAQQTTLAEVLHRRMCCSCPEEVSPSLLLLPTLIPNYHPHTKPEERAVVVEPHLLYLPPKSAAEGETPSDAEATASVCRAFVFCAGSTVALSAEEVRGYQAVERYGGWTTTQGEHDLMDVPQADATTEVEQLWLPRIAVHTVRYPDTVVGYIL